MVADVPVVGGSYNLVERPDAPSDAVALSLAVLSFMVVRLEVVRLILVRLIVERGMVERGMMARLMVMRLMVVRLMVVRLVVVRLMVMWLIVEKTLFAETPSEGCRCCPIRTELGHGSLLLFSGLRSATVLSYLQIKHPKVNLFHLFRILEMSTC